jgi:hypothetical protein
MNTTFGIGNVLATGFRIWLKNFIPFTLITALIYVPLWIWGITSVQGEMTPDRFTHVVRDLQTVILLTGVLNLFVAAALTYGVVMELQGQRASVGACIATGFSRFFPVLGVVLLSALCAGGATLLLIIPGVIVFCMLYVATPTAVLERPGVMGALGRSRELTRGHRLEIFGLVLILALLGFGLRMVVQTMTLDPRHLDATLHNAPAYVFITLFEQMVVNSIGAVMASVAYYFLRAEKEGVSAAELAAVFD